MASYKFTLRHPDGVDIFGTEYVSNWADISTSLTEHDVYKGVLREFSNTFEFNGYIRNRIVSMLDIYGYDVAIYLTIEKGNDNKEQWSFVQWSDELKADIQSIDIDELTCKLDFADNEFTAKLMARHDTKVNLDVTESIDGDNIGGLAYSDIKLHDRKLIFNSLLQYDPKIDILNSSQISGNDFSIFAFPFDIKYRSDDNFKSIPFNCSLADDLGVNSFYLLSEKSRQLNISIKIKNNIKFNILIGGAAWKVELIKVYKDPETQNITYNLVESFYKSLGYGGEMSNLQDNSYFEFDINFDGIISLSENESLQLGLYVPAAAFISRVELNTIESSVTCTSNESYPETQSKCLRPHEGFSRLVKILTGTTGFYSEFFGRKDLGYATDGAGAYLTLQNGRMIRNFPAADYHLNTSLKEMFQSFDAVYCLCAAIEKRDNKDVFRVEPYETFRNMKRVVKLGDFTNNISRSINPKRIFSEIVVGYKDQEYEELNGTFQFNGETNYSAPITTEGAKLDAICKYRADDIGIELTRRLQYADDPSKDYRADKDIFLIDAKPINGILEAKKAEDFNTVSGIYEPQLSYNLDITPARNLRRWGSYIRAGFIGIEDRKIKFVKGASNQALTTTKTGEDYTVTEGADVLISDLSNPIEYAESIKIAEAAISDQDFININENRGGLVEFESAGVKLFGRIAESEFDANKKIINFELNRAYGI